MSRLLWIMLAAGLVVTVLAYAGTQLINLGGSSESARQEKANATLSIQAAKGRTDYDTCDRADGLYDFAKGTCQLPAAQ